jgi:hypothetical protein
MTDRKEKRLLLDSAIKIAAHCETVKCDDCCFLAFDTNLSKKCLVGEACLWNLTSLRRRRRKIENE